MHLFKCLNLSSVQFIFLRLSILIDEHTVHANMIIIDKVHKSIERFEPYGSLDFIYYNDLDNLLETIFFQYLGNEFTYIHNVPKDNTSITPGNLNVPHEIISFQTLSKETDKSSVNLGDPIGYCLAWNYWFLEQKIRNKNIQSKQLIPIIIQEISHDYIQYIRNYAFNLDKLKNEYLLNCGVLEKNIYKMVFNHHDMEKIKNKMKNDFISIIHSRM